MLQIRAWVLGLLLNLQKRGEQQVMIARTVPKRKGVLPLVQEAQFRQSHCWGHKGPCPPPCKDIRSAKFAHLPHPERCASASCSHRVSSTEQSLCCLFPVLFLTCVCHRSKEVHQVALRSYGLSYSCGGTEQSFICLNISHSEGLSVQHSSAYPNTGPFLWSRKVSGAGRMLLSLP